LLAGWLVGRQRAPVGAQVEFADRRRTAGKRLSDVFYRIIAQNTLI
jgi:hypothetical protein